MTTTDRTIPYCPNCHGPLFEGHIGGLLEFGHASFCTLLRAEEATKASDREMHVKLPYGFRRPVTEVERLLLESSGYVVRDDQETYVQHRPGVRIRRWRDLVIFQPWQPIETTQGSKGE